MDAMCPLLRFGVVTDVARPASLGNVVATIAVETWSSPSSSQVPGGDCALRPDLAIPILNIPHAYLYQLDFNDGV